MKTYFTIFCAVVAMLTTVFGRETQIIEKKEIMPNFVLPHEFYMELITPNPPYIFVSRTFVVVISAITHNKVTVKDKAGNTGNLQLTSFYIGDFYVGDRVVIAECFFRKDKKILSRETVLLHQVPDTISLSDETCLKPAVVIR